MHRTFLSIVLGLCLCITPVQAWWETGHQAIARIAASELSPAARTRVARILGVSDTAKAVSDALAKESTWADETKGATKTGAWHYIDLTEQDKEHDIASRCPDQNCAPARITEFAEQLRAGTSKPDQSQLDALRYLVHLVGDIHQPLHAISDADLGGNCELLTDPVGTAKNLHALWDGGIIHEMDMSSEELTASLLKQLHSWNAFRRWRTSEGSVNDWVWQSHLVAEKEIYAKLHIPLQEPVLPKSCPEAPIAITQFHPQVDGLYVDAMKPVVREQLIRGGLRLAHVLNESL